jgi:hypothetical protein
VTFSYSFDKGSDVSNSFLVLNRGVIGFDAVNLSITVEGDLFFSKGFELSYSFADPALAYFTNAVRFVLAGSALYAVLVFFFCVRRSAKSQFQAAAIVLGAAGVLATHPVGIFFPSRFDSVLAPVLAAAFLATFRWFVFAFLEGSLREENPLCRGWAFVYLPFLAIYAAAESAAGMEGGDFARRLLRTFHIVYIVSVLAVLGAAALKTGGRVHFRVVGFGIFVLATVAIAIASEIVIGGLCFAKESLLQLLVYHPTHIFAAIVFLFFEHPSSEKGIA